MLPCSLRGHPHTAPQWPEQRAGEQLVQANNDSSVFGLEVMDRKRESLQSVVCLAAATGFATGPHAAVTPRGLTDPASPVCERT
jgi:hypothetical protein